MRKNKSAPALVSGLCILLISASLSADAKGTSDDGSGASGSAPTSAGNIREFRFSGNTPRIAPTRTLIAIAEKHRDKDPKEIASKVAEEVYHKKGYWLAVIDVNSKDCATDFRVLEGRVRKVNVVFSDAEHRYSRQFIINALKPVTERVVLNKNVLNRALLILNDQPGMQSVTALLRDPGEPDTAGYTDLEIRVKEQPRAVTGSFEFNTFGSSFASRERFVQTVNLPNLSHRGDMLAMTGVSGMSPNDLLFGQFNYGTPITSNGTRLSAQIQTGTFEVGQEFAILGIKGSSTAMALTASHPLRKSTSSQLLAELSLEVKDTDQKVIGTTSSMDRIRAVRMGLSYNNANLAEQNIVALSLHQGLGNGLLGAMPDGSPLSSRPGADNRFTKLTLEAVRQQPITWLQHDKRAQAQRRIFMLSRLGGQYSTRSLVAGEQFSIGGADSVRGYPTSEFLGDSGLHISMEMRLSPLSYFQSEDTDRKNRLVYDRFQFALFADHASIFVQNPIPGQAGMRSLTGVGLGFRGSAGGGPDKFQLRADVGFPVGRRPSSGSTTARPYFQIVRNF